MAFDVEPQDVVVTDDWLEARFQTPGAQLESGAKTLAQILIPPINIAYPAGVASFRMPYYDNGKYCSVRLQLTPVVALANTAGLAGPATITTDVHYLGWNVFTPPAQFLFDGINRNPEVSVRREELLLPVKNINILELTSLNMSYQMRMSDLWMPTVGPDQIFRPEPVGAVHFVFVQLQLFVRIYYK
jgi:hypothetical protein